MQKPEMIELMLDEVVYWTPDEQMKLDEIILMQLDNALIDEIIDKLIQNRI